MTNELLEQPLAPGFSHRLHEALSMAGIRWTNGKVDSAAMLLRHHPRSVRSWIAGYTTPSVGTVILLAQRMGISPAWLVTGRGPRYPALDQVEAPYKTETLMLSGAFSTTLLTLAQAFASLSLERKRRILVLARIIPPAFGDTPLLRDIDSRPPAKSEKEKLHAIFRKGGGKTEPGSPRRSTLIKGNRGSDDDKQPTGRNQQSSGTAK